MDSLALFSLRRAVVTGDECPGRYERTVLPAAAGEYGKGYDG